MNDLQRVGGVSALIMAGTFVVAFAVFLGVLMPAGYLDDGIAPADKVAILVENQLVASIGWLIPYVVWGIFMVVLSLALYDRLKAGAPAIARTATAIGLIWAALVIAAGLVATLGIRTAVDLYGTDPAQAGLVWVVVETVAGGLGGEAWEVLGGVWLLLIGWAALRARELPRALSYLALVLGVAGVVTVVPPLKPAVFIYGVGLIVWWVWLGTVMLRDTRRGDRTAAGDAEERGKRQGLQGGTRL
ncbi:MAG: DUF4386 family protein [Euryarchaeota archaeon]|jgi:hypothetical protein|nr:DUF4386 family protein [Euryarchaeota archaeon]